MSWSEKFFGKALNSVEAGDIMHFFRQQQEEGQHLEFKSGEVRTEKVLKEIVAFLNSEGGLLILGAPREADIPGMVNSRGSFGEPVPSKIASPEKLIAKINEGITPVPKALFVHQVKFNGGNVFLIDIRPSQNPPHQVYTSGCYYIRDQDTSRPARHEEVEKMFLRMRKADPEVKIALERQHDSVKMLVNYANVSTISAENPGFELEAFPVCRQEKLKEVRQFQEQYLPKGKEWQEEMEILPADTMLFLSVKYYCRDVETKIKAAFVEIQNRKVEVLHSYDSDTNAEPIDYFFQTHSHLLEL